MSVPATPLLNRLPRAGDEQKDALWSKARDAARHAVEAAGAVSGIVERKSYLDRESNPKESNGAQIVATRSAVCHRIVTCAT